MSNVNDLAARIQAEISAHKQKVSEFRSEQVQEFKDRTTRHEQLEAVFKKLAGVWKPRLESLAAQFKDSVQVTPKVTPGLRQGTFAFNSPLAKISLRFAASTDTDVKKVVLTYDLDILPIYLTFEKHAEIEFPLEAVDESAVAKWLDDRIVAFVKVYLSLYENEYYLKDHMVEDPVSHVRFPKFVAGATAERNGKTYYFISDDTRREFESKA
jgi:YHS domain-containing protein